MLFGHSIPGYSMHKGGDTMVEVGGLKYKYVSTILLWALAHSHLGGSGGMLPPKIFKIWTL